MKFGRTYSMRVEQLSPSTGLPLLPVPAIDISYPLTLNFSVERSNYAGANRATFSITNLKRSTQQALFFDWYKTPKFVRCALKAGYETEGVSQIFSGNIHLAWTERQGAELVTHIEALDGGYGIAVGKFDKPFTFGTDTPFPLGMQQLMRAGLSPAIKAGVVNVSSTKFPYSQFAKNTSVVGNVWEELQKYTPSDSRIFVDQGTAHVLGPKDVLPEVGGTGVPSIISSSTGLINTPKKTDARVVCDLVFEPRFQIGQFVSLQSKINPRVNGPYTIMGIAHSGTISATQSGSCTTSLTLLEKQI